MISISSCAPTSRSIPTISLFLPRIREKGRVLQNLSKLRPDFPQGRKGGSSRPESQRQKHTSSSLPYLHPPTGKLIKSEKPGGPGVISPIINCASHLDLPQLRPHSEYSSSSSYRDASPYRATSTISASLTPFSSLGSQMPLSLIKHEATSPPLTLAQIPDYGLSAFLEDDEEITTQLSQ